MLITPSRLSSKVATVALPEGVDAVIVTPSELQVKWSPQTCSRGWNKGVSRFVLGSRPNSLVDFRPLHPAQESARLSNLVLPPSHRGRMCSNMKWIGTIVHWALAIFAAIPCAFFNAPSHFRGNSTHVTFVPGPGLS